MKLRPGVYWSDGVEFTSADVVFTSDMLLNTPEMTYSSSFASNIKSITAVDDYTIQIETVQQQTRLESILGSATGVSYNFYVVPQTYMGE